MERSVSKKIKIKKELEQRRIERGKSGNRSCIDFSALLSKRGKGVSVRDKEQIEILTRDSLRKNISFPDKLIPLFSPLILGLVTKVLRKNPSLVNKKNDLVQCGYMGLVTGLNRFNPDAKNKVTTYVFSWIRRAILTYAYEEKYLVKIDNNYPDVTIFIANCFKKKMSQDQIYKSLKRDGNMWLIPSLPDGEIRRIKTTTLKNHISLILFEISFDVEDYLCVDEKKIIKQHNQYTDPVVPDDLIDKFRDTVIDNSSVPPREKSVFCDWFGESGDSFSFYDQNHETHRWNIYNNQSKITEDRRRRNAFCTMYSVKEDSVRNILSSLKDLAAQRESEKLV